MFPPRLGDELVIVDLYNLFVFGCVIIDFELVVLFVFVLIPEEVLLLQVHDEAWEERLGIVVKNWENRLVLIGGSGN